MSLTFSYARKKAGEFIQNAYLQLLSELGIGGAHPGGLNLTKEILQRAHITSSSRVLDVGCGTGQTTAYLSRTFGAQVTAIDINPTMLEKAKHRLKQDKNVIFIEGSIEKTSLPQQEFDVIISESVLAFVHKPRALREIYRLLKDGGCFIAIEQTMNERLPTDKEQEIMQFYGFDCLLLESNWQALFAAAGFHTIDTEQHPTIESEPDFHYSAEINPALYDVMKKHLDIMTKYQGLISYRVYRCMK